MYQPHSYNEKELLALVAEGNEHAFKQLYLRKEQKEAVAFLQENLFKTPDWLLKVDTSRNLHHHLGYGWQYLVLRLDKWMLQNLLSYKILTNLNKTEEVAPAYAYPVKDYLNDLKNGIWSELKNRIPIDRNRRNLQKLYAEHLTLLLHPKPVDANPTGWGYVVDLSQLRGGQLNANTDLLPLIKQQVDRLIGEIDAALPKYKDEMTILHLREVKSRLKEIQKPDFDLKKVFIQNSPFAINSQSFPGSSSGSVTEEPDLIKKENEQQRRSCWERSDWELK